ncbi:hypothetical protein ETB97_002892 [Aspergillus alliaceus]|uniref:Uncharacterized protein n=1 Tax=Petromyces alliaceus TaxID=209559 RepID=A0A8H6E4U4_PETAA|nr:hypothetical protein ETB97_002892 [Aspergillus burnettii]
MSPDDFLPPSVHRLTDGQPLRSSGLNILNAPKLQVTLTNEPKLVPAADAPDLAAHKIFTDHMVTEAGSTNFFVDWTTTEGQSQMITPPLDEHTILPGVTRQTVLDMARGRLSAHSDTEPVEILEHKFTINDIVSAANRAN